MSEFKIIVPEATTNLFTDPIFGAADPDTAYDISATGGSSPDVTRTTTDSFFEDGAALFDFDGASNMTMKLNVTVTATDYTLSAYVKRSGGAAPTSSHVKAHFDSAAVAFDSITLIRDGWYYCEYTATATAGSREFGIQALEDGLLTDGWQMENKAYATTLAYGSLEGFIDNGYQWTGTVNASTSTRSASERSGGRVYDLTDLGVNSVNGWNGGGAFQEQLITSIPAIEPGAIYQNNKILPRYIDIAVTLYGATLTALHTARNSFYNAVKSRAVLPIQPMILRYTGGSRAVEINTRYAGGMGLGNLSKLIEKATIRLFSEDPFWRELGNDAAQLDTTDATTMNYLAQRTTSGSWSALTTALGAAVKALAKTPNRDLYIGGDFTNAGDANGDYCIKWNGSAISSLSTGPGNNVLSLVSDSSGNIWAGTNNTTLMKWNGSAWAAAGTAPDSTNVYALTVDTNNNIYAVGDGDALQWWDGSSTWTRWGAATADSVVNVVYIDDTDIYFGGSFTTIGGVSASGIAKYDTTTGTFSALGTGIGSGGVSAIAVSSTGTVYAGGSFTTIGGVTVNGIGKWNGSAWSAMGTTGVSGGSATVNAIAIDSTNVVFVGGDFTAAGGVANTAYLAKWTGSAWAAVKAGSTGANSIVYALKFDSAGLLYAGGDYTTIGGTAANRIAVFNGSAWSDFTSGGVSARVQALEVDDDDNLYIGGRFTNAGDANGDYIVYWNGSAFVSLSAGISPTGAFGYVYALEYVSSTGRLYVGGDFINNVDANGDYLIYWDGSAFHALAGGGTNNIVFSLALFGTDIVIGGQFSALAIGILKYSDTDQVGLIGITYQDNSNATVKDTIYDVVLDGAGAAYICGAFKTVQKFDTDGSLTIIGSRLFDDTARAMAINPSNGNVWIAGENGLLAYWNGSQWTTITTGTTATIYALAWDDSGNLYIGGAFTSIGGTSIEGIARWNNDTFYQLDIDLPGTAVVYAILVDGDEVTLGFSTAGTATPPGTVTVTNTGTAEAFPILKVTGPGTMRQLSNETTGKVIRFQGLTLGSAETVTLDFRPFRKTFVSNVRTPPSVISKIQQSDLTEWSLATGANVITLLVTDASSTASIIWEIRHESADGSVA